MREWISANIPAGPAGPAPWSAPEAHGAAGDEETRPAAAAASYARWERRLLAAGLVCPAWPRRYGGAALGPDEVLVLEEECARAGVPRIGRGTGELVVGPVLLAHGTEEQRSRLLPRILSGEDTYCQAYSEAPHGSDLASVTTRGTVTGDEITVTGRKSWVHGAHRATTALVLCRTDPGAARHRGLSCVAVRLDDGDTELRPVRTADGARDAHEIVFDGARAPLRDVIGGPGGGWSTVMTAVAHHRAGRAAAAHLGFQAEFWDLVSQARKSGRTRDPLVRDQLAWAYTRLALLRWAAVDRPEHGAAFGATGPESAVPSLLRAEYHRRFGEIALNITGAAGLVRPEAGESPERTDRWQQLFLSSRGDTIAGGTAEILRDIIAERVLGLPKEPRTGGSGTNGGS
ncbi:acyl-CoA dehydrogenase family protein [Streptomyces sp. NPDC026672]|uniref:acyl-CoA dehydrogenase family protein n=1 Tax=unclassified Streptomyces TaxID=2593676 RepID=UPI0033F576F0